MGGGQLEFLKEEIWKCLFFYFLIFRIVGLAQDLEDAKNTPFFWFSVLLLRNILLAMLKFSHHFAMFIMMFNLWSQLTKKEKKSATFRLVLYYLYLQVNFQTSSCSRFRLSSWTDKLFPFISINICLCLDYDHKS